MILPAGQMGSAALTLSRSSFAAAEALVAAALTALSALGPAAISDLRSLGSDASTAARSITDLPSTSPRPAPWPFWNIISRIARVSSSCVPARPVFRPASAPIPAQPQPTSLSKPHELAAAPTAVELAVACLPFDEPRSHALARASIAIPPEERHPSVRANRGLAELA